MKLAVMQPYLFPYIGYFQLINSADTFVVYDDVGFIKQGWINRNNILLNNAAHLFTFELKSASSFKKINEIEVGNNRLKILKTFEHAYKKAPCYHDVMALINVILNSEEKSISRFIYNSLLKLANYLKIDTKILLSSAIEKNNNLEGSEKILSICKLLNADTYINAIGGMNLYSKEDFKKENIELFFLKTNEIRYKQFSEKFVPHLSIIDVLMFNSRDQIKEMLNQYELI